MQLPEKDSAEGPPCKLKPPKRGAETPSSGDHFMFLDWIGTSVMGIPSGSETCTLFPRRSQTGTSSQAISLMVKKFRLDVLFENEPGSRHWRLSLEPSFRG